VISLGRDGPLDSCGKKVLNHQIFFVSYLQFVERKPMRTVLCSAAYGAVTVARELYRRPFHVWYHSTPKSSQEDGSGV